jgi:hypothetical protein
VSHIEAPSAGQPGDIEAAVLSFEVALRRAEQLTGREANYWDEELERVLGDEFNVPDGGVLHAALDALRPPGNLFFERCE